MRGMKLGLISDIHADPDATRLAIDLLRRKGAEQIVCAGDHIERGPHGDEAVRIVRAEGVRSIAGNHDLDVGRRLAWLRSYTDDFNNLTDETVAYLVSLPGSLVIDADSARVLVAHGTPWDVMSYVFPAAPAPVFERLAKHAGREGAGAVVLGHTHLPMQTVMKGVHIVNPGSVAGTFTNGSRTCAILTLPERDFKVYDIESGLIVRPSRPVFEYDE